MGRTRLLPVTPGLAERLGSLPTTGGSPLLSVAADGARPCPPGWHATVRDELLGVGPELFDQARISLWQWQLHSGSGLRPQVSHQEVCLGAVIEQTLRLGPVQLKAPCRVTWVVETPVRMGYAYSTLDGHPERGEELFAVELLDDQVWLRIRACSRPARWYSRAGALPARLVQRAVTNRYVAAAHAMIDDVPDDQGS